VILGGTPISRKIIHSLIHRFYVVLFSIVPYYGITANFTTGKMVEIYLYIEAVLNNAHDIPLIHNELSLK